MGDPGRSRAEAARTNWPTSEADWAEFASDIYRKYRKAGLFPADAEDRTQDTAVAALRGAHRAEHFSRWIAGVCSHLEANWCREQGRRARVENVDEREDDLATSHRPGAARPDGAEKVLSVLPRRQRTAIHMRFLEDLSIEEVAMATRTTEATVRSRISRGLERLRESFDREQLEELLSPRT